MSQRVFGVSCECGSSVRVKENHTGAFCFPRQTDIKRNEGQNGISPSEFKTGKWTR